MTPDPIPPAAPEPTPAVKVYRVRLDVGPERLAELTLPIAQAEKERALRFRVPDLKRRFIACRAQLREILAAHTGRPPREIAIAYNSHGKPWMIPPEVEFNVTHTGDLALIAVAPRDFPVGIDLENTGRRAPAGQLAKRFFRPEEIAALEAAPGPAGHQAAFLRIWTAKEAVMKAAGFGLALDPRRISCQFGDTGGQAEIEGNLPARRHWVLLPVDAGADHVATIAMPEAPPAFACADWPAA